MDMGKRQVASQLSDIEAPRYQLDDFEAGLCFSLVASHCEALKNWIASAVENGEHDRAKQMVKKLRRYQELYAKLNVEAHRLIDASKAA